MVELGLSTTSVSLFTLRVDFSLGVSFLYQSTGFRLRCWDSGVDSWNLVHHVRGGVALNNNRWKARDWIAC